MAKPSGLPDNFTISASKDDLADEPVKLGDYLDESLAPRRPAPNPATQDSAPDATTLTPQPRPQSQPKEVLAPAVPAAVPAAVPQRVQPVDQAPAATAIRAPKPTRLQINLSVEGKTAHESIMDCLHGRARQRDIKHAEVYQALALALADSLQYLDVKNVPERGAWGSPTARSFVTALKTSFVRAIAARHAAEQGQ